MPDVKEKPDDPTAAMIEAGVRVLGGAPEMSAGELVVAIWEAMQKAASKRD